MKISDSDISFVVQGPVQGSNDRKQRQDITTECLYSIRKLFPSSKLILSTWKGQDLTGLDYDLLVELDDPGPNFVIQGETRQKLNNNRQIYSSYMGLKATDTNYSVKLRTDNKLVGREFIQLFEKYSQLPRKPEYSLFNSRVLTSSTFFIRSHVGRPVHFHKSDLFDFGETRDLLKIWSKHLIPELVFKKAEGYKSRYPASEQFLCLNWLARLLGEDRYINTKAGDDAGLGHEFWEQFIAHNLIVDSPERIGLDVTERFYKRGNLSLEYDLKDWLHLNGVQKSPIDWKRMERMYKEKLGVLLRTMRY